MPTGRMPAGHSLLTFSDVPDRQSRDGPPELVTRCKHPVIPVPVLARRRHEIGEPVEKLKRREVDDAIGPRPRGLAAGCGPIVEVPVSFLSVPKAGCRHHTQGHATGNSSPTRAMSLAFGVARCRGRAVCRMSRSSRRAGASAAAARDRPAGPRSHTARVRQRRWRPGAWSSARAPGQPSWLPCVAGARSGRGRGEKRNPSGVRRRGFFAPSAAWRRGTRRRYRMQPGPRSMARARQPRRSRCCGSRPPTPCGY